MSRRKSIADISATTSQHKLAMSSSTPMADVPTAPNSAGITSTILFPFMALAFAIIHIIYHTILFARYISAATRDAFKHQPHRAPSSFASLPHLLDAHQIRATDIRVPTHMGVVLADFVPSWIRLYISTLLIKLSQRDVTSASDVWREFRTQYYAATEAKNINDMATMIHLARISGVEQLSIFTSQPLSSEAVQKLNRALLLGYKTKVVLAQQDAEEEQTLEIQGDEQSWSRYTVLRRRTACGCTKGSDSSSTSWPGSPASSDSEAGPCSLDETMASSYTADNDAQMVSFDATVHIRIGLLLSSKAATPDTKRFKDEQGVEPLQVNLLSQEDGHERFAQLISQQIHHRAETYFCDILLADINSAASNATKRRFSTSSLRKAWVCKRQAFTSKLTVAELDRSLAKTGYMGEPELVVVFGGKPRLRKLYGFPAWPIRLSDLFFDAHVRSNRAYDSSDFVKALRKLAKTEHRYGR